MKTTNDQVRAPRRLAPGGLLVAALGAIVLFTASAIGAEHTNRVHADVGGATGRLETPDAAPQDPDRLATLLDRVRGSNEVVCRLVNRALENRWGGNGRADVLDPLNADAAVVEWAVSVQPGAELLQPLRSALQSDDACVQRTAAQLLGHTRVDNLAEILRAELASSNATTRAAALRAIGYRGHDSSMGVATAALKDGSEDVRVTAIWVLGRIGNDDAIPTLTELLAEDASPRIRRAAAWALGRIAG